jgi:hypothetical protein
VAARNDLDRTRLHGGCSRFPGNPSAGGWQACGLFKRNSCPSTQNGRRFAGRFVKYFQ